MKIKLTLRGRTREDIDLLVTTDATATVGDVAAALASSGPRQSAATLAAPDSLTLRVLDPVDGRITSVLPSTAYVTETGLNSGSLVDIASAKDSTPTGGVAGELRVLDGNDKGMCVPPVFRRHNRGPISLVHDHAQRPSSVERTCSHHRRLKH